MIHYFGSEYVAKSQKFLRLHASSQTWWELSKVSDSCGELKIGTEVDKFRRRRSKPTKVEDTGQIVFFNCHCCHEYPAQKGENPLVKVCSMQVVFKSAKEGGIGGSRKQTYRSTTFVCPRMAFVEASILLLQSRKSRTRFYYEAFHNLMAEIGKLESQ